MLMQKHNCFNLWRRL